MGYVITVVVSYLLGCSSMAHYLGKAKKMDIREHGTGNLGASNTAVTMGWGAAILVGAHDVGKGALAVLLVRWIFPELELAPYVAGVACVLGHIFPFYLGFRGGKGLASFMGMTAALNIPLCLVALAILILVTVTTNYIALGSIVVSILVPVGLWLLTGQFWPSAVLLVATLVMFWKHWINIRRILAGTEIGLRKTVKGEDKVK